MRGDDNKCWGYGLVSSIRGRHARAIIVASIRIQYKLAKHLLKKVRFINVRYYGIEFQVGYDLLTSSSWYRAST